MSTKSTIYTQQALAATGFAVQNSIVAWRLRPDLWASDQECGVDFRRVKVAGTLRMRATLAGLGPVIVLARSTDMLAKRIEWITGFPVSAIEPAEDDEAAATAAVTAETTARQFAAQRAAEAVASLKALAAQEPPAHDCVRRRDILRARAELGMRV